MRFFILLLTSLMLLGLTACKTHEVTPTNVALDPHGESELLPDAVVAPVVRERRRMDLDQLKATISQVTEGLSWTEDRNGTTVDLFDELSGTLGKPNYIETTSEDLTASPLFQKFMTDAANGVCVQAVARDLERTRSERVIISAVEPYDRVETAPDAVNENLKMLLRRFHGRNVAVDSDQLNPWAWLFETSTFMADDPIKGWEAVCVALMTHPDFYSY